MAWWRWSLGVVAVVVLVFAPYFFEGRFPINADYLDARFLPWSAFGPPPMHNPELDDPILCYLPLKLQAARTVAAGQLPLWNPQILCGTPLLADGYSTPLHPLSLLFSVLPPLHAWTWLIIGQTLAAGLGMYWFLQTWIRSPRACLLGAICGTLATCFATFLLWPNFVGTYGWLPVLAAVVERMVQRPRWTLVAGGGLALGVQFWCCSPQLSVYMLLSLGLIATVRLLQNHTGRGAVVLHLAAMGLLGLGLGAVVLLPMGELFRFSQRMPLRYMSWTCPEALATWLWKDIYGNPTVAKTFLPVTGYYITAFSGYIGLWALIVAVGAVRRHRPERLPYVLLAAAMPLYVIVTSFWPVRHALAAVIPGYFSTDHLRAVGVSVFGLATLAAFGLEDGEEGTTLRRLAMGTLAALLGLAVVAAIGVQFIPAGTSLGDALVYMRGHYGTYLLMPTALALGFAAWSRMTERRPQLWAVGVLVVVALDLGLSAQQWLSFAPSDQVYPVTPGLAWLQKHEDGRILVTEPAGVQRGLNGVLPPNTALPYGLQDVRGYESLWIQRYRDLIGAQERDWFNSIPNPDRPLVDLLGVRYLVGVASKAGGLADTTRWHRVYDYDLSVFENQHPCPLAFVAPQWQAQSTEDIFHSVQTATEDLHSRVLLEPDMAADLPPSLADRAWQPAVVQASPGSMTVTTDATYAGLLVLSETWYPGWTATVDGTEVPVRRAYAALQMVPLPAGRHLVVFRYDPPSVRLGAILSVVSGLLCLLAYGLGRRKD